MLSDTPSSTVWNVRSVTSLPVDGIAITLIYSNRCLVMPASSKPSIFLVLMYFQFFANFPKLMRFRYKGKTCKWRKSRFSIEWRSKIIVTCPKVYSQYEIHVFSVSLFWILPPPWYLLSGVLKWHCFLWLFKKLSVLRSLSQPDIAGKRAGLISGIFEYWMSSGLTSLGGRNADNRDRMGVGLLMQWHPGGIFSPPLLSQTVQMSGSS